MTTTVLIQPDTTEITLEFDSTTLDVVVEDLVLEIDTQAGAPGLSAYQIAVANGFTGTQQQWLDSLKGDAANSYSHIQGVPSALWTINHNLGFYPSVTVVDTNGDECEGDVEHPTLNQTTITFSAPFAGQARLI